MTEEPATEKQIAFMEKLGIPSYRGLTKAMAKNLIKANLEMEEKEKPKFPKETKGSGDKYTTMYVSYVKDLIVAGIDLDKAINIIKHAKREFE